MSIKEEYQNIELELLMLKEQQSETHKKIVDLEIKKDALLADYLLEEAILSQYSWHIKGNDINWCVLECSKRASDWKVLSDLAETDYHCHKEIEKGINLYFDDRKISIRFNDGLSQMADFIKKHNLKIGVNEIQSKYNALKKSLASMEDAIKLLNGKV